MQNAILIASFAVFTLIACHGRQAPLYDVAGTIPSSDGHPYSMPEVGNAILRAGLKRGWAMYEETPGHIVATLDVRSHHVSVDIKYDQQNYSLNYNESRNMNHDGANIHPKYNEWISRLNRLSRRNSLACIMPICRHLRLERKSDARAVAICLPSSAAVEPLPASARHGVITPSRRTKAHRL
jgi:hypothetical protein